MEPLVQRAGNRKKGEHRRGLRWFLAGAVLASGLGPAYLWRSDVSRLGRALSESVLNRAYFEVREINVRGGRKVGGNEIVTMAGLTRGMRIWSIDPRMIENKVAKHPWVKRVMVRREFPRRVVIEIEERVARAILVLGGLYYVDAGGSVFKEVGESERVDLPLITGLSRKDLTAEPESSRLKIREALRVEQLAEGASLALSEVHFLSDGGVVLYPMNYPVALRMGWGDWEKKFNRLEQVLVLWRGREDRLAALNANFSDQVVARLRGTRGAEAQLRNHG